MANVSARLAQQKTICFKSRRTVKWLQIVGHLVNTISSLNSYVMTYLPITVASKTARTAICSRDKVWTKSFFLMRFDVIPQDAAVTTTMRSDNATRLHLVGQ